MLGMMSGSHHLMLPPIWQFALASIVQLWLAIPFYRGAIGSIRGGLANMDVLVSTGTLTIIFILLSCCFTTTIMQWDMCTLKFLLW